jgi:PTS system mannose-specific IIA component
MVGVLVVTHGGVASELVKAVRRIVGEVDNLHSVSIGWDDDVEQARRQILESIHKVDKGEGVLILTDMFGGTPTNLSLSFLEQGKVEIITGVNLPMLIKFYNLKNKSDIREVAQKVKEQGQKSIYVATDVLGRAH